MDPQSLVAIVLALQFAVFGWRISREIQLSDEERKTWLLLADYLNFLAMLAMVTMCVIAPLATGEFGRFSRAVLAAALVLVVFYPIILAGHYRLFSKLGRSVYKVDVPYVTGQEAVLLVLSLLCAGLAAYVVGRQ